MFKNYYLFKKQIREIKTQICGATVISVYTVHRNELIFDLHKNDEMFQLAVSIDPSGPYILIHKQSNYKSAKFQTFDLLYEQEITDIELIPDNKFIVISLNRHYLTAYFYSAFPNIIVYNADNQVVDSFKSIKNDKIVNMPKEVNTEKNANEIRDFIFNSSQQNIKTIVKHLFPSFNNQMLAEVLNRLRMNGNDFPDRSGRTVIFDQLIAFKNEIDSGKAFIYRKRATVQYILLYRSSVFRKDEYDIEEFLSVNKAWTIFTRENQIQGNFSRLNDQITKAISKRKKTLGTALSKLAEAEDVEKRKETADLIGNLILTNKHKIPRAAKSVELLNIFDEGQEKITIKLNPKKTAVENATYYFQKYKNIAEKKQVIALKKNTYEKELKEITRLEQKVQQASLKDLLKIKEQLEDMNIIQTTVVKDNTKQSLKYAFKRLILDNAWDIYIGKNNMNNELLTFSFANKWDIWMHAQGVAGSHVIIKLPGKNITTPKHIIEQAARIAAANSKGKHSSVVPVIYTQVRYVSKIRAADPGTVSVKNEKVVFVKPLDLNQ